MTDVPLLLDIPAVGHVVERGPAGPGVVLGLGAEEAGVAADAGVRA